MNMHPSTDGVLFWFNLSTDSGSNYNVTKTTTHFLALHTEDDRYNKLNLCMLVLILHKEQV
jgi:hypothetical protein